MSELVTLEKYKTLTPFEQGFIIYMEEALPGSELKGSGNPYDQKEQSESFTKWNEGNFKAMLEVQDGEE